MDVFVFWWTALCWRRPENRAAVLDRAVHQCISSEQNANVQHSTDQHKNRLNTAKSLTGSLSSYFLLRLALLSFWTDCWVDFADLIFLKNSDNFASLQFSCLHFWGNLLRKLSQLQARTPVGLKVAPSVQSWTLEGSPRMFCNSFPTITKTCSRCRRILCTFKPCANSRSQSLLFKSAIFPMTEFGQRWKILLSLVSNLRECTETFLLTCCRDARLDNGIAKLSTYFHLILFISAEVCNQPPDAVLPPADGLSSRASSCHFLVRSSAEWQVLPSLLASSSCSCGEVNIRMWKWQIQASWSCCSIYTPGSIEHSAARYTCEFLNWARPLMPSSCGGFIQVLN